MNRLETMQQYKVNAHKRLLALAVDLIANSPELLEADVNQVARGHASDMIGDMFCGCEELAYAGDLQRGNPDDWCRPIQSYTMTERNA